MQNVYMATGGNAPTKPTKPPVKVPVSKPAKK